MSSERDDLALELFIGDNHKQPRETSIQDWTWLTVTGKARGSVEHYKTMAEHILSMGYRKPVKVKGNTPLGKIRELFKHLDSWESQEHSTVGIDYLRRHFKEQA